MWQSLKVELLVLLASPLLIFVAKDQVVKASAFDTPHKATIEEISFCFLNMILTQGCNYRKVFLTNKVWKHPGPRQILNV
jgi:hypothetical protein